MLPIPPSLTRDALLTARLAELARAASLYYSDPPSSVERRGWRRAALCAYYNLPAPELDALDDHCRKVLGSMEGKKKEIGANG
jgi:hypothetical protein